MTDTFTVRAVVLLLGLFAVVGLLGLIFLVWSGTTGSDLAIVVGPTTTALGALAAVLVSTRSAPAAALPIQEPPAVPAPGPAGAAAIAAKILETPVA